MFKSPRRTLASLPTARTNGTNQKSTGRWRHTTHQTSSLDCYPDSWQRRPHLASCRCVGRTQELWPVQIYCSLDSHWCESPSLSPPWHDDGQCDQVADGKLHGWQHHLLRLCLAQVRGEGAFLIHWRSIEMTSRIRERRR